MGPVLVYQRGFNPYTIVAYDVGRQRPIWSAKAYLPDGFEEAAVVNGGVVLTRQDGAYFQDIQGSPLEKLFDLRQGWVGIGEVAVAPDEITLAFSIDREPEPIGTPTPSGSTLMQRYGSVFLYDLAARQETLEVIGTADNSLSGGALQWRADSQGVNLQSYTHSERPGPRSAVFLDGSAVLYDVQAWAYLSPDGTKMVHGITSECEAIGGPDLYMRDLDRGVDLIAIHNNGRAYTGVDWSPDGQEFWFQSRPYDAAPGCQPLDETVNLLLDATTGLVNIVTDLESMYRRWYGDDLVWIQCQGRFEPFTGGHIGSRTAFCLDSSSRIPTGGTLHYRGTSIDSSNFFRVYGIIP
jgi:hypothetical protein